MSKTCSFVIIEQCVSTVWFITIVHSTSWVVWFWTTENKQMFSAWFPDLWRVSQNSAEQCIWNGYKRNCPTNNGLNSLYLMNVNILFLLCVLLLCVRLFKKQTRSQPLYLSYGVIAPLLNSSLWIPMSVINPFYMRCSWQDVSKNTDNQTQRALTTWACSQFICGTIEEHTNSTVFTYSTVFLTFLLTVFLTVHSLNPQNVYSSYILKQSGCNLIFINNIPMIVPYTFSNVQIFDLTLIFSNL